MTPQQFIDREVRKPFRWGVTDCCSMLDRWCAVKLGYSPRQRAGLNYTNEAEARALIDHYHGGMAGCMLRVMAAGRFAEVQDVAEGDVGLGVAMRENIAFAGLFVDGIWLGRDADGWMASVKHLKAWRVI